MTPIYNVVCANSDPCLVYQGCDNATGCQFVQKTCLTPTNKCNKYIRNSSDAACCVEVPTNNCDVRGPCFISSCNATDGSCSYTSKCNASTPCFTRSCDLTNGTCYETPVDCTSSDPCFVPNPCNDTVGCTYSPKTCGASTDPCKVLFRNSSDSNCCQYIDKDCDSGDKCYNYGCNNNTGACTFTKKCNDTSPCFTRSCDPNVGLCVEAPITCVPPDTCHTVGQCDDVLTGCQFLPITCNDTELPPCFKYVANNTFPGCCQVVPKACNFGDPCRTYSCDNSTGQCTSTPLCQPSNQCFTSTCSAGNCAYAQTDCSAPDKCQTSGCDNSTGCVFSPLNCDDNDPCTVDSCIAGNCSHITIICDDNNTCTDDTCVNGLCQFSQTNCDDNNSCTIDTCDTDTAQGCVHTDINASEVCNDNNLCTLDLCTPTNGCTNVDIASNCTSEDPCSRPSCISGVGCISLPRLCVVDPADSSKAIEIISENSSLTSSSASDASCKSIPFCVANTTGNSHYCYLQKPDCGFVFTTAIYGGIGAAAIAGIVIGIILFCLCSSGAMTAAVYRYGTEQEAKVNSNPLYEEQSRGGHNPLWNEKIEQ